MHISPHTSKVRALLACALVYALALAVALGVGYLFRGRNPILLAGGADIAATIVVFIFSVVFNNSSIYDPYWSLAPVPIALYWTFLPSSNAVLIRQIAVLLLLTVWAARLTYHCLDRWQGLKHEDWRYAEMRGTAGRFYWLVSFFGFHFFPTIIVFLGCLSLYSALSVGTNPVGVLDIVAIVITISAIWIEARADRELKTFVSRRQSAAENIATGLWAYSRHPNYFGEVLFWWGLYLFALSANFAYWWAIIGPVCITMLFLFVSIPMMDRHILKTKPAYVETMKRVSALVPWLPKKTG
jgi:steroid 5-alpha reductase family enzyme